MNKTPETRVIGGSRILLVRKYDGQSQPPMSPPKRCLLEREIKFLDLEPPPLELDEESPVASITPLDAPLDAPLNDTPTTNKKKTPYSLIGGSIAVSALIGFWLYTQNNSGD